MLLNDTWEQEIRKTVEKILARKEFHQSEERNPIADMINQIGESILEWIRGLFENRKPADAVQFEQAVSNDDMQVVLKIVLILLGAVLLFLIVRLVIRRVYLPGKAKKSKIPKAHDYLENPDLAAEKMRSLMEQGEYTQVLRYLFVVLLLMFHERKIIHIEKWKTNRAYLREIAASSPDLLSPMKELSMVFNACCYGGRTIDQECMSKWFTFYVNEKGKYEKENQKLD